MTSRREAQLVNGTPDRDPSGERDAASPKQDALVLPPNAPLAPNPAFAEGVRFDGYVLGQCIGHGGMAHIYVAEHEALRRQVALKVLSAPYANDPDNRERFLREARIAAAIKHPNVVNIFDVGVHEGAPYLVMEYLEGTDLDVVLESKKALAEDTLLDLMIPIVAGLAAVHDAGVVHRDLKPGNIFLARGPRGETIPKLLDFGISKAAWPEQPKVTAMNGLLMGTPSYMSPEALQGDEMTAKSDQYSLGVVLYECATGINPFATSSFQETVRLIVHGEYPRPSAHNPALSRRLEYIIERALSLHPADRYADTRELGRELLTLAGHRTRLTWGLSFGDNTPIPAPELTRKLTARLSQARALPPPPRARRRSRKLPFLAAALLPLSLLAMGLVTYSGKNVTPEAEAAGLRQSPTHALAITQQSLLQPSARGAVEPSTHAPEAPPAADPSAPDPSAGQSAGGPNLPEATPPSAEAAKRAEATAPARAPVAAKTTAPSPARKGPAEAATKKPRPWWLPDPERDRRRPANSKYGANNAPILD